MDKLTCSDITSCVAWILLSERTTALCSCICTALTFLQALLFTCFMTSSGIVKFVVLDISKSKDRFPL